MSKGIRAFLVETVEDKKILRLKARWPVFGKYVWMELLREIYGVEGYYMDADDESLELFAGKIDVHPEKVRNIVQSCLEVDLFDTEKYKETMILTSAAIQRSYMQYNARTKEVCMEGCFLCGNFDKNAYKNLKIVYKNGENVCNSAPITLHNITLHSNSYIQTDEDGVVVEDDDLITDAAALYIPDIEEVKSFIALKGVDVDPDEFMKYYKDQGWLDGEGKIVKNWKAKVMMWGRNKREWKDRPKKNGKVIEMPEYMKEGYSAKPVKKASAEMLAKVREKQAAMKE